MGVPAAVESLHRRRQNRTEREHQSRAFRELDSIAALNFVPAEATDMGSFLADRAATIAGHYDSARSPRATPIADSAQNWTPQDWVPEDRIRQRWIPEGWLPQDVVRRLELRQEPEPASEASESTGDMTLAGACALLGVTSSSTPTEIRSAYRRLVIQCHPDRIQRATETVRERATQLMTDLNEAYRLLRTMLLENAA
jgi:hypothetical protein